MEMGGTEGVTGPETTYGPTQITSPFGWSGKPSLPDAVLVVQNGPRTVVKSRWRKIRSLAGTSETPHLPGQMPLRPARSAPQDLRPL